MDTASGPYSSVDNQIFACIEAAKTWDKDATLKDFQLSTVGNELVLIHLKTSRAYVIEDDESALPDLQEVQQRLPDLVQIAERDRPDTKAAYAHVDN